MRPIVTVLLLAASLALTACAQNKSAAAKELSAEELAKYLEQPGKLFFLDVRQPAEIRRLGSVKGYVNIPLDELESRLKEIPKDKLIVTL